MQSDGLIVRLGDLIEVKHGWPFKSELFSEEKTGKGIVVAIGNFRYTGGFRFSETATKEYRGTYPAEYDLLPGDILLVMTCQTAGGEILGIPARVPDDGRRYLHNQRLGKVVLRSEAVLPSFLYWLFLSPDFNRSLVSSASGTKILHTSPTRICDFRFRLPSIEKQRDIADALDALQDRMDLLRRTNTTLESIAQALFKSWFIDFEPVRAKQAGREPDGMDAATATLFPAEFEESALGSIPKGWRVGAFGDLADLAKGSVNPMNRPDAMFEHYSLPAFDASQLPAFENGDAIKSNKTRVPAGAVLQSKLNPHIPRVWFPTRVGGSAVCSTEFLPWLAKKAASPEVVYCVLTSSSFEAEVRTLVTGTSNSHQRVKPDQVAGLAVVVAPSAVYDAFTGVAQPLHSKVGENRWAAKSLADLRDALLPRLISGKLRLPEAPEQLEEAVA